MKTFPARQEIACAAVSFSALLFFATIISTRSGYSWAMGLTLLAALASAPRWWRALVQPQPKGLALLLLGLAVVWSHSFDTWLGWSTQGDFLLKYGLGAVCALGVGAMGIHPKALAYGLALGCASSAAIALLQFPETGRANGFTNAIRFGNLALVMGVACWLLAVVPRFAKAERAMLAGAGALGLLASVLSLSRGGWLLLLVLPFLFMWFTPQRRNRLQVCGAMTAVVLVCMAGIWLSPGLKERVQLVQTEAQGYLDNRNAYAASSVGARLEQWQLAWRLGLEKPVAGWGTQGLEAEKLRRIETGEAHPSIREIAHTHNDLLEMWAARGILGVAFMLAIYGVPVALFFPSKRRMQQVPDAERSLFAALHLMGCLIPLSYFLFGLTDVFFNLSIGHNFYIFALVYVTGAIASVRRQFGHAGG